MNAPGSSGDYLTFAEVDLWVRRLHFRSWGDAEAAGLPPFVGTGGEELLWDCAAVLAWVRRVMGTRWAYVKELETGLSPEELDRLRRPPSARNV